MSAASTSTDVILRDLNEPQRRAVTHGEGPLLVLAGPGSGKTRVITRRAAHLVSRGAPPSCILAITFTNKAAEEMRQRIGALGVQRGMWVYTFHALGARLLGEFGAHVDVRPNFTIYDEADRLRVVRDALEACDLAEGAHPPQDVVAEISGAKSRLQTPADYGKQADRFHGRMYARIYECYERLLRERNAVDFDDLLMRIAILLRDHGDVREALSHRFRYLLIDEYQDTNRAQYLIARQLSQHHNNICATGDPDQSIYGWRGADLNNILDFEHDYPDATIVRLEENYRSTQRILRVASALIANNRHRKPKELWTQNNEGQPVCVQMHADGAKEAAHTARTILEMRNAGRPYSDFAIFYRVNAISREIEDALRGAGIPYRIVRGTEFYNRKEIRDVLAYLRVLVNPVDQVSLLRIVNTPTRGIGKVTITRLLAAAEQSTRPLLEVMRDAADVAALKPGAARKVAAFAALLETLGERMQDGVARAVSAVLSESGLEAALEDDIKQHREGALERLENVRELVSGAAEYEQEADGASLSEFLQRIALSSDQDALDETADAVILMTLHTAKGLEFPVVFIVAVERGVLPHERAIIEPHGEEEERRLLFVGITRARERLFLSHTQSRWVRGVPTRRRKSNFLDELPDDEVHYERFTERSAWGGPQRGILRLPDNDDAFQPGPDFEDYQQAAPDADVDWEVTDPHEKPASGGADGDEPRIIRLVDHVPGDQRGGGKRRQRKAKTPRRDAGRDRPRGPARSSGRSRFVDWKPGTVVQHQKYGIGRITWIRPSSGVTRAGIKFTNLRERTFILELAPILKWVHGGG